MIIVTIIIIIVTVKIRIVTFYACYVPGTVLVTSLVFSFNTDHNCKGQRYQQGHGDAL